MKDTLKIIIIILLTTIVIEIPASVYAITKEPEEKKWISTLTEWDKFGYGETNIGTSGLHVYTTRDLLDGAGYVRQTEDNTTNWEVTIVADSVQQTEYLIFKDKETGNIAAVERRKYEETVPEEMRMYLSD